jgi:hypothetical protein
VKTGRLLAPYMLLSFLTLGAGLGVGLGLSEGTATYAPTAASSVYPCRASPATAGLQVTCTLVGTKSYSSSITVWFEPSHSFPRGTADCLNAAVDRAVPNRVSPDLASFETELTKALRSCGVRGKL